MKNKIGIYITRSELKKINHPMAIESTILNISLSQCDKTLFCITIDCLYLIILNDLQKSKKWPVKGLGLDICYISNKDYCLGISSSSNIHNIHLDSKGYQEKPINKYMRQRRFIISKYHKVIFYRSFVLSLNRWDFFERDSVCFEKDGLYMFISENESHIAIITQMNSLFEIYKIEDGNLEKIGECSYFINDRFKIVLSALSKDGLLLAIYIRKENGDENENKVLIMNMNSKTTQEKLTTNVQWMNFSNNNDRLFIGSNNKDILIYSLNSDIDSENISIDFREYLGRQVALNDDLRTFRRIYDYKTLSLQRLSKIFMG